VIAREPIRPAYQGVIDGRRLVWLHAQAYFRCTACNEDISMMTALAFRRAMARGLVLALTFGVLATVAGCAGTSGDYWRERPASQNYMRLPVR
jgi:hypothetical protein